MHLRIFTFLYCTILSLLTFGQVRTGNFVRTSRFLDGAGSHAVMSTTHFDGLGRPAAEIRRTGRGEYAASLRQYDLAGRETRKWCEVPVAEDVMPEADAFGTEAASFYSDARPFAETAYDAMDCPVRFWREGQDWLSHPSASCRVTNMEGEVLRYYAAPGDTSLVLEGCFPAAALIGEERTDEDGHTIRSFYDRQGRMLLMRRADGAQTGGWCDTYYVYDVFGMLRFVLTPGYQSSGSRELSAYEYRYDRLRRCVWKRMPGQGPVTYAYDAADRVILEQDPILRERGLRRFFVYDGLGRSVMQGTCRDGGTVVTRPGHHFMTADFCPEAEGMLGTGYVMVSACVELVEPTLEIVSYYDEYGFLQHGCLSAFAGHDDLRPNNAALATGINARGMKTGEVCRASDGTWNYRTFYYDGHGREVARHESMSSGKVCKTLTEYSLTGKTTCVTRLWPYVGVALPGHAASTLVYSLATEYGYDEWTDEVESVRVRVGCNGVAGEAVCVLAGEYDALGRLASQTVPSPAGDIRESFSYDLHGWRTEADHPLFSERLHYADGPDATRYCYNGNASAMQWRASDGVWRGYRLRYSDRDMLKEATYATGENMASQTTRYSEKASAFNADGAITRFVRYGRRTNGSYNYIDYLSMAYDGQRLRNVSDSYLPHLSYTGAFEYVDGHSGTAEPDFEYNAAGLLVMDRDRGISRISYTDFARPDSIVFASGAKTVYSYTPDGRKLAVRCLDAPTFSLLPTVGGGSAFGSTLYQTDYITDGLEITRVNGIVPGTVRFDFGSGYLTFTPGASAVSPQYFHCVRDHLESVRSVWTYDAEGDSIREVQRTAYYPFGGIIPDLSTGRNVQRNLFCGKEYDTTSGLNLYDFGARLYDPAAPHFLSPDPLQESYYPWNAYAYCLNNPVKYVDPEGKAILIEYYEKGWKLYEFRENHKDAPNSPYVQDFIAAYMYNIRNGGGDNLRTAASNNKLKIIVRDTSEESSYFSRNGSSRGVYWKPRTGLKTSDGGRISPATILEHEMDHAVNYYTHREINRNNYKQAIDKYDNQEEKRVITGSERKTAIANGESIRENHKGENYQTISPTTTIEKGHYYKLNLFYP